jgi:hypothetical protein
MRSDVQEGVLNSESLGLRALPIVRNFNNLKNMKRRDFLFVRISEAVQSPQT